MTHSANRRQFLGNTVRGFCASTFGGLALAWAAPGWAEDRPRPDLEKPTFDLSPKKPAHQPRAKAVISLWMQGGPSQIDLFDPKPVLNQIADKPFPGDIKYDNAAQASSKVLPSPWKFAAHGECGMQVSELLPHFAKIVDDVCLIRSLHTDVNNHGQSIRALHTGDITEGQPGLGSWITYALGSQADDLPAYCALIDPGQLPVLGVENWSNGWLPALYQGTVIRPQEPRILNLTPPKGSGAATQRNYLEYVASLNQRHRERHADNLDLQARMMTFDIAAKMQVAAREAMDLSGETKATRQLYGLDEKVTADYGARCLIARRLIERGVRYVQVFTQNQYWDHHGRIRSALPKSCQKVDQPASALVQDLKQRGLLDETLVHWGGEMGRLPVVQNDAGPDKIGRDHNTYGFSSWLAGGGIQPGLTFGETDEFGHKAVVDPMSHHDFHATILHLLGISPSQVVFQQNTRQRTFPNLDRGRVMRKILA